ncbi:hypothetical protein N0V93_003174 [Gnomoniopsis smithogilvyi]|uniref:Uncharacterized protein n=1 Tax=Gnomoniopsis smithogilvyi TaxID=1191159 RepID=A0A9W9CZM3_9PEZI|nr:hypothetical protein N0V93_003174 [Gnomoniopsis smithogilvyi]
MEQFNRYELRICILRCTELVDILQPYPDLHPIQDGANQVLSTLLRMVVRTIPLDAEIHNLAAYNQEILAIEQRRDSWAVTLDKVQSDRDAILLRMGFIREISEIYSPASNFRQSVGLAHSAATTNTLDKEIKQVEAIGRVSSEDENTGEVGEDETKILNSNATVYKTKVETVLHETDRNILMRAALRDCASGNGAYISLDKDADDALREAAINKIAGSISAAHPCASLDAQKQIVAASRIESESAIEPSTNVDRKKPEKVDVSCSNTDTNVLDNLKVHRTTASSDTVEDTELTTFDIAQQSDECIRDAVAKDHWRGLVEPKLSGSESNETDSSSEQPLPALHILALNHNVSEPNTSGSRRVAPVNTCSLDSPVALKDMHFVVDPEISGLEETSSNNASSRISSKLPTPSTRHFTDLPLGADISSHLENISPSNAENTASLILETSELSKDLFKKQHSHRALPVLEYIFATACRDSARAASYARCLKRVVDLISPEIRGKTMKDKRGVTLPGSRLLCAYLRDMCQEYSTQVLSDPEVQLGFPKFLGQLHKNSFILDEAMIHEFIRVWLENGPCIFNVGRLYHLLKAAGGKMDATSSGPLKMTRHFEVIEKYALDSATAEYVVVVLVSLMELRDAEWQDKDPEWSTRTSSLIKREVEKKVAHVR